MYLLAKDKDQKCKALRANKIAAITAFKTSEESDEFGIMIETDWGGYLFLDRIYDDWSEAKEDMLMFIFGIEELQEQGQAFTTAEGAIKYAREKLDRVKDGSGKTV